MSLQYFILVIILLLGTYKCNAQVDSIARKGHHKFLLAFSSGVAIPVGTFAEFEVDPYKYPSNISGVAGTGFNARVQVVYLTSRNFGFSGMFYSSYNIAQDLHKVDLFSGPAKHGQGGGYYQQSYTYETSNWQSYSFLAGLVGVAYFDPAIINFRMSGGIQYALSPESNLKEGGVIIDPPDFYRTNKYTVQPSMTSYNYVINLGVDFQVPIHNKWGIIMSVDYFTSHASFNGESKINTDYYDEPNKLYYESTTPTAFTKNYTMINFNLGAFYILK